MIGLDIIYIYPIASNREELKIEFINKIDDFVVNQYYINCATENSTIGYPIQYCPICGKNLNKS